MRRMMLTIAVLCALTLTGAAQQPSAPRFEVASIKLWQRPITSAPGIYRGVPSPPGSGIFNRSTTLAWLIAEAYDVQDFQLSGGEDWLRTERYDVSARAGRDVSEAELGEMVKALLADRFKLRLRTETRDVPILELRLARSDGQVGSNLHNCSKERVPETPFRAPTNGTVSVSDCADGGSSLADMASRQLKTSSWTRPDLRVNGGMPSFMVVVSRRRYRGWIHRRKGSTQTCRHSKAHFVSNSG